MNTTSLLTVYALAFSGKRVAFIYGRTSKRLPSVCPLSLYGQVIYDPITLETQFICYDHRYRQEIYQAFKRIEKDTFDDTAYRKICNISHKQFLDFVHMFHVVEPSDEITTYQSVYENNTLFG